MDNEFVGGAGGARKRFDSATRSDFDAQLKRSLRKTLNDCFGRIGGRKHSAVIFSLQLHSSLFEPGYGIFCAELREKLFEETVPSWVVFGKKARLRRFMGDVAAASSRNPDFIEDGSVFFEN